MHGFPPPAGHLTSLVRGLCRLACLATVSAVLTPALAQAPSDRQPPRPHLASNADTNSATAYYAYGLTTLLDDPKQAATAFYWATRLDPTWVAPLYAERTALLLTRPPYDLTLYLTRPNEAQKVPGMQRIDSLAVRALLRNPFVDRRLDGVLLSTWLARQGGDMTTLHELGKEDPLLHAWAAYARGDYRTAVKVFGELMKDSPQDPDWPYWRGLARFAAGQLDSARQDLQHSVILRQQRDEMRPWLGWVSRASAEYGIGLLFTLTHQPDSAQAAYERALLVDVGYDPAHYERGKSRLAAHDTAGAIGEYVQAVTLAPSEAGYLNDLGTLLVATGRADSGTAVLQQAIAAEPYYAFPHYTLGLVYEQTGMPSLAATHFEAFLALAPQTMAPAIASARRHLAALHTANR